MQLSVKMLYFSKKFALNKNCSLLLRQLAAEDLSSGEVLAGRVGALPDLIPSGQNEICSENLGQRKKHSKS